VDVVIEVDVVVKMPVLAALVWLLIDTAGDGRAFIFLLFNLGF
jgi:hypothetical protein